MAIHEQIPAHRTEFPSIRHLQALTHLDVDDYEQEDFLEEQRQLNQLAADNSQIQALYQQDFIDLTDETLTAEAAEQVIEEAEAIANGIDEARVPSFVGIMTAQASGVEIFNSVDEPSLNRHARWSQVTPPPGKGEPLRRQRPRLNRADPAPLTGPRASRDNDWRRPLVEPSNPPINDEPIIDLTDDAPKVIPPKVVDAPKTAKQTDLSVAPRPEKKRWRDRIGVKIGAVAVAGLAVLTSVGLLKATQPSSSEQVKSAAPIEAIKPMETVPAATSTTKVVVSNPYNSTRNAEYREFYRVNHDMSDEEMDELDSKFKDAITWMEENPGQDLGQALSNFKG